MRQIDSRLWDAAIRLFAAKGFAATSIREIADEAGLSVSAMYYYVRSKEELLAEIMRVLQERLVLSARLIVERVERPDERLAALVALHVLGHAEHPLEALVVDNEVRALGPDARREIVALRDEYESLWREALEQGVAADVFHVADTSIARLALLEMCNGVSYWFAPSGPLSREQLAEHFVDLALGLVRASRDGQHLSVRDVSLADPQWIDSLIAAARDAGFLDGRDLTVSDR